MNKENCALKLVDEIILNSELFKVCDALRNTSLPVDFPFYMNQFYSLYYITPLINSQYMAKLTTTEASFFYWKTPGSRLYSVDWSFILYVRKH